MKRKFLNPYLTILLSFMAVILIGTLLLLLPFSVKAGEENLSFVDALFMTTSATCVTGLSVVSNVGFTFSVFGKIIIAILMEIGGLSFLTIAAFVMILSGAQIGMSERYLIKESLNQDTVKGTIKLVKNIVIIALVIQFAGSIGNILILSIGYGDEYTFWEAFGIGIFHSISSFNNAGFDIFGYGNSMQHFSSDILLNLNTMILIILGGISSIVILDVFHAKKWKKMSLHSKIVLTTTFSLIIIGTILIKLGMGKNITFLEALFQSVTARTAGFSTIDISGATNATIATLIFLMFVGASPCSTGGGVKTTTLFIIFASIISLATGRKPHAFNRRIGKNALYKAYALTLLALLTCFISMLLVSFFNPEFTFRDIIFEVTSAFATVGLSTGVTTSLSIGSRLVLVFTMLAGRVGLLTLVNILNKRTNADLQDSYQLLEERVIVG